MFNFVYSTPCDGKVTGTMRLGRSGHSEILPYQNLGGEAASLHPDVPAGDWLPMENLGKFETADEMYATINGRQGWSLVPTKEET